MLKGSKHWTKEDTEGMQHWMVQYAEYLDTDHVMNERRSINNHGTYFDLQYVSILRYLGRIAEARHYLKTNGKERLQAQVLLLVFCNLAVLSVLLVFAVNLYWKGRCMKCSYEVLLRAFEQYFWWSSKVSVSIYAFLLGFDLPCPCIDSTK